LAASGQNPGKNCQLYTVIKTSIQRPPLLSSRSQLLAVPRVILFCFVPLLSSQLSRPSEWMLNRGSPVIYRKIVDFVFMLHLSVKLQLFIKIMISATDSYLSYITSVEDEHTLYFKIVQGADIQGVELNLGLVLNQENITTYMWNSLLGFH